MASDEIERRMQNVAIEDNNNNNVENDYYVLIDVLANSSPDVARAINGFMISEDSFDPRRAANFPTDLMDHDEREADRDETNIQMRRVLASDGSDTCYEFWKVRGTFDIGEFHRMIGRLPTGVKVRLVAIIDNEHEITQHDGEADL